MSSAQNRLRQVREIEVGALRLYMHIIQSIDSSGRMDVARKLMTIARIGESFMIIADILEAEGDYDFGDIRAVIDGVYEEQ